MLRAKRLADGALVEAASVERGPKYVCPVCADELVIKKGRIVVHHFAHRPPVTCEAGKGETPRTFPQSECSSMYSARGASTQSPRCPCSHVKATAVQMSSLRIRTGSKDLRSRSEHTPIEQDAILRRTNTYLVADVSVIWVAMLDPARCKGARYISGTDIVHVERYAAKSWERWAADTTTGTFGSMTRSMGRCGAAGSARTSSIGN